MRDFFPLIEIPKGIKLLFTCTVSFLFRAFFSMLCEVLTFFALKNHQADNKNSKQSNALLPQGEIKNMKLPLSKKTFICQQLGKGFE